MDLREDLPLVEAYYEYTKSTILSREIVRTVSLPKPKTEARNNSQIWTHPSLERH